MFSPNKSLKLSFKGDKKKKKSSHKSSKRTREEDNINEENLEGWSFVEKLDELRGPLSLLIRSDPVRTVIIEELGLDQIKTGLLGEDNTIFEFEPFKIEQVLVSTPTADNKAVTFKTCFETYLASDKIGKVTAERTAVGESELWIPIIKEDGIAFQNSFAQFLTFDPKTNYLRSDSETIGFYQTFLVKCQAKFKVQARNLRKAKEPEQNLKAGLEMEATLAKKYQSHTNSFKTPLAATFKSDKNEVKKAVKEGNVNEFLLQKRAKTKSDRYCK